MGAAADVNIAFNADTSAFVSNVSKGRKVVKGLKDDVDKGKNSLDALKKGLGEDSKFGAFAKIISGAGAVAGLTLVGNELNKLADKFAALRKEAADGAGAGQIADELAKSLPIFGGIYEAGRKFRAEMDGSADALRKITAETTTLDALTDYYAKRFERMQDSSAGIVGMVRRLKDELAAIGQTPQTQALLGIGTAQRNEREEARKTYEADRKKVLDEAKAAREKIADEYAAKERAYRSARDNADSPQSVSGGTGGRGVDVSAGLQATAARAKAEFDAIASQRAKIAAKEQGDLTEKEKAFQDALTLADQKAGQTRIQLEKQIHGEIRDIDRQAFEARISARRAYLDKIADMDAANRDARLRFEGKNLRADQEALFRDAARQQRDNLAPVLSNMSNPFAAANGTLAQQLLQATGMAQAIKGQRDQRSELLLKTAIRDKILAGFAALPENPASLLSPDKLGEWAKGKLFGYGKGHDWGDTVNGPMPLAQAQQRRFDFTIAGVDNPQVAVAKDQLKVAKSSDKAIQMMGKAMQDILQRKGYMVVGVK